MDRRDFEILRLEDFSIISFSGPFEILCRKQGRLNVLREVAINPEKLSLNLSQESDRILNSIKSLLEEEDSFDAAWIWSDLGYKENLFFSPEFYKKNLFPLHKRLFSFLNSYDIPVIFHSDGKIDAIIPYLLKAGVKALHPIDEYADMDIAGLRKRYGKEIYF